MRVLLASIFASSALFSATYNKIDNDYTKEDVEKGYHFYDENQQLEEEKKNVKINIPPKSSVEAQVLVKIYEELINLKKEVKKLNSFINPNEPKMVQCSDGKVGLSNSRPECFQMPVITEGRNMPALYNFMQNPNEDTASNWLGVQAKLFNRSMKMGYALRFAHLNNGSDVYPVSTKHQTSTYGGIVETKNYLLKIDTLKEHKENLGVIVFLGETPALEKHQGPESISRILRTISKISSPLIVFKDEFTFKGYENYFSLISTDSELKTAYNNSKKEIFPELFEKYKIKSSPTIVAVYKNDKEKTLEESIIGKGFLSDKTIIENLTNYLKYKEIIKPEDIDSDKQWREK